jgi:hypothetical protein
VSAVHTGWAAERQQRASPQVKPVEKFLRWSTQDNTEQMFGQGGDSMR